MRMIVPIEVDDTVYVSSNLDEDNEHSAWDVGDTYAEGDYAYSATTHKVYKSVQAANIGHDPTTDDGTWWVEYSATNAWKPFDKVISDVCVGPDVEPLVYVPSGSDGYDVSGSDDLYLTADTVGGEIELSLSVAARASHVALFNLSAPAVTVVVKDLSSAEVYNETQEVGDFSDIIDWYSFFFVAPGYETEVLFEDLPIFPGYTVDITVGNGSGAPSVGQIVIGWNNILGLTSEGTEVGFQDFSTKDQNDFGQFTITERAYSRFVNFEFVLNTQNTRHVERLLADNRATPCVYWADSDMLAYGTFVYGFFDDFAVPLKAGPKSYATLDVKGLT